MFYFIKNLLLAGSIEAGTSPEIEQSSNAFTFYVLSITFLSNLLLSKALPIRESNGIKYPKFGERNFVRNKRKERNLQITQNFAK